MPVDLIINDSEKIGIGVLHRRQVLSPRPDTDEDILGDLFGGKSRLCPLISQAIDPRPVLLKEYLKGNLIPRSNGVKERPHMENKIMEFIDIFTEIAFGDLSEGQTLAL
jgi:hypothetical protein